MTWPPSSIPPATRQKALRILGEKPKRRNAHPEADIQKAMVQYLDIALPQPSADYWWSGTLNGVRLKTPAARRKAREQGLRPGLYDLVFAKLSGPEAGTIFLFEVKGPDGRLTAEQKAIMDVLWPLGRAASGKSVENLRAALIAWDFPIRARV